MLHTAGWPMNFTTWGPFIYHFPTIKPMSAMLWRWITNPSSPLTSSSDLRCTRPSAPCSKAASHFLRCAGAERRRLQSVPKLTFLAERLSVARRDS